MSYKLSLNQAILINMNIMLGAGIFLNPVILGQLAGALSPLSYLIVGAAILPLILSIATMLTKYPGGSFYEFGTEEIGVHAGFLSGWSYFMGKLASGALMLHFGVSALQHVIPILEPIPIAILDAIVLAVFTMANLQGMQTGSSIQRIFMLLKVLPIAFVIGAGLYYFTPSNMTVVGGDWHGFRATIALIIYAFTGFEASCSLSSHITNAKKNAPRAIIIAFLAVLALATLFQLFFYAAINLDLLEHADPFYGMTLFLNSILPERYPEALLFALQCAVGISALGGAYGILYSNVWNLHTLAKKNHVFFSKQFTALNRDNVPYIGIILEALICGAYLIASRGDQIPLQLIGALGCTIAYTMTVLSLLRAHLRTRWDSRAPISVLGLISCLVLLAMTLHSFYRLSAAPLYAFAAIIFGGFVMLHVQSKSR